MTWPRAPLGAALLLLALLAMALLACRRADDATPAPPPPSSSSNAVVADASAVVPPPNRFSDEGMLAEAALYLDHPEFRRAALVEALANPSNTYSRQRLDAYALRTQGWDLLPEWNPQSVPATTATAADLRAHRPLTIGADAKAPRIWDGKRPTTMAGWIALGRDVFFGYPLRVEVLVSWALEHPDVSERLGVRAAADGTYPGVRLFTDVEGRASLGITCAICHASVSERGQVVVGDARRAFDYGALRLAYHKDTGVPVDPDLARRMRSWGPGRADVTEDDDEDPVAIPDLWGLRHQTALTQAGTIKHTGPTVLAIRQETQLLQANHQKIRPPRVLAYALALFLYSLEPGARPATRREDKLVTRGQELFAESCKGCHSNASFGGPPVPAEKIGTDRALAFGGARGTGKYRPPALIRVSAAAPYFHHGAVPSLEDVLSPARLEASYARSPLAKGPVPGHTYGTDLPSSDRAALVAYLRSL